MYHNRLRYVVMYHEALMIMKQYVMADYEMKFDIWSNREMMNTYLWVETHVEFIQALE